MTSRRQSQYCIWRGKTKLRKSGRQVQWQPCAWLLSVFGQVSTYTGHEETERASECEAHSTCHDGFCHARLHACLHLVLTLAKGYVMRESTLIPSSQSSALARSCHHPRQRLRSEACPGNSSFSNCSRTSSMIVRVETISGTFCELRSSGRESTDFYYGTPFWRKRKMDR